MNLTVDLLRTWLQLPAGEESQKIEVTGVAIDSREVAPGNLFVCLAGERVDGHDYALKAQERGCVAILASRPLPDVTVPVLVVPDPEQALALLAGHWRDKTRAKVIAVTGTAGKTTLKETLASIMRQKGKVAATKGNHNNQLGLPLTILNTSGDEDYWILELGISRAGDMELLGSIARPDLAVILNVGPGHTEGLGEKGVAWHKSRLLQYVKSEGYALVNGDCPQLVQFCANSPVPVEFFGISAANSFPYRLVNGASHSQTVALAGEEMTFATPFSGEFGAENVLAASAVAHFLGLTQAQIAAGFTRISLPPHRYNHWQRGNIHIFDDTYNANPLSMQRMLNAAGEFAREQQLPLYLLLGAMGELGTAAFQWHEQLGCHVAALKPAAVFWRGGYGEAVTAGMRKGGLDLELLPVSDDFPQEFMDYANSHLNEGLALLAKGSRINGLENPLRELQKLLEGRDAV